MRVSGVRKPQTPGGVNKSGCGPQQMKITIERPECTPSLRYQNGCFDRAGDMFNLLSCFNPTLPLRVTTRLSPTSMLECQNLWRGTGPIATFQADKDAGRALAEGGDLIASVPEPQPSAVIGTAQSHGSRGPLFYPIAFQHRPVVKS